MAGRIRDEDVTLVKERADIAAVVGEHVTLRQAGPGRLKGLCPFHDEKTPSFTVNVALRLYKCFGCDAGGDVIDFLMTIDRLTFAEAVESLAGKVGVQLRYEDGGTTGPRQHGQRTRLVDANAAAAEWFRGQLQTSAEAMIGRRFLADRGLDVEAADVFGVGYAPQGWELLVDHLRRRGFTAAELLLTGLAQQGQRGPIDRFRGRLVWPIRDLSGDVVGFGARKLRDEDTGPKYLNTPETPLYRKSAVLYGVDLARKEIARRMQAVVVEGYTDVMACHLAGVRTAIATCGTAFGDEHIKILRRLLMDQSEFRGEVIFTFDGDAAGQRAALRAFAEDQKFVTQTFVAVEPTGLDPCDLRRQHGDTAVRDLVARRVPLFEFAIRSVIARYDLDTPEGRVSALRAAAPLVGSIRDRSLRPEYTRTLAGWLGMEVDTVAAAVAVPGRRPGAARDPQVASTQDPDDSALLVERESLKVAVQMPTLAGATFDQVAPECFTAAPYAAVHAAIARAGGCAGAQPGEPWVAAVRAACPEDVVRSLVTELAVEVPRADRGVDSRYAQELLARLAELATTRRVTEVKSRLQRLNPVEQPEVYNRLFGELIALEQHRRLLREQAIGGL